MSDCKYYYGFNGVIGENCGSFCIVTAEFWDNNKKKEIDYINDDELVDTLEKLGFYECMQNVYEYNLSKMSNNDVRKRLEEIGYIEYNEEFSQYLEKYNKQLKDRIKKEEKDRIDKVRELNMVKLGEEDPMMRSIMKKKNRKAGVNKK